MRLDVFGTLIEVNRHGSGWQVLYVGAEGKKRLARDISIPAELQQEELVGYLGDLLHEWARPGYDEVKIIE